MKTKHLRSLESYLKHQAVRWSLLGFAITTLFGIPWLIYAEKVSSERQLLAVASAGAAVFRPMILEGGVRDAEIQMRAALKLKEGESAIVRNPKLETIYALDADDNRESHCKSVDLVCWTPHFNQVSLIYPLYFDEPDHRDLFGYLEITLRPALDYSLVYCLLFLLLAAFVSQAFGLSHGLSRVTKSLSSILGAWSHHLKHSPSNSLAESRSVPFAELKGMAEAVDGLHYQIQKLQSMAAQDARVSAHLSILRSIGHDLRTPHSQLAQQITLLLDTVEQTGELDLDEVNKVKRTLKRMGDLIRQVRSLSVGAPISADADVATVSLVTEIKNFVSDLQDDPEIIESYTKVRFTAEENVPNARISRIQLYRVTENLFRNALHATSGIENGQIDIQVVSIGERPTLVVRDNGCGIPEQNKDQIFDFDFTTRPARGTGLGLGIVKLICTEIGAIITFHSELNYKTEFNISFQRAEDMALTPSIQEQGAIHGQI